MEYKIIINYETGDSFHNETCDNYLELTWTNLNVAKENLQRIKEHYEQHKQLHEYAQKLTADQIFLQNKNKDWFVYEPKLFCISSGNAIDEKSKKRVGDKNWEYRADSYYAEHCIKLKTDNDDTWQISAFWCGYFETLNSAEIETDDSDMKIEF